MSTLNGARRNGPKSLCAPTFFLTIGNSARETIQAVGDSEWSSEGRGLIIESDASTVSL
jgi:hypothetical protein